MTSQYIYLNIKNRYPSVQHYYHFLLGFLVPLVHRLDKAKQSNSDIQFLIRSCGPMDRHVESLNYKNLIIVKQKQSIDTIKLNHKISIEYLYGFDDPRFYSKSAFIEAKNIIKERLKKDFDFFKDRKCYETILINRSIDNFYNSPLSEIKTSGIQRRSISNFDALEILVKEKCNDTQVLILENTTLAEQIFIFENTRKVIAQHGAALTNLIFCNNTKVIEIIPEHMTAVGFFSELAFVLGLQYASHVTNNNHAPVNLKEIARQLTD